MNFEAFNKEFANNRNICLATLVLTGVLTQAQLEQLIASSADIPDTWQGIVEQIQSLKSEQPLDKQ